MNRIFNFVLTVVVNIGIIFGANILIRKYDEWKYCKDNNINYKNFKKSKKRK